MALPSPDPRSTRGPPSPAEGGGTRAWSLIVLAIVLGLAAPAAVTRRRADEAEKTVLGGLLSRALSTPSSRVAIGAVDGALSSDAIDPRRGDQRPRRRLAQARPGAHRLAAPRAPVGPARGRQPRGRPARRAAPADARPTAAATPEPDGKLLPDLPVKVEIKGFSLAELVLGEAIAGQPARLSAKGRAKLGAPSEGLDLRRRAQRLDAGRPVLPQLLFVPQGERLELKANLIEPAGGLLSKGPNMPGTPPIDLDLDGRGHAGCLERPPRFLRRPRPSAPRAAPGSRGSGAERRLALDLAARIEGLLPGPAAAVFSGTTKLDGGARLLR